MTALPSQSSLTPLGSVVNPLRQRQEQIDALIATNRRLTPQSAADNRAVPRSSIAELNALDMDQIRERFLRSRHDSRPPIVRVLDLIDLPRNAIANVLFPGAAREATAKGERAALGMPRVNFSDALSSMGVENRVVRGLVGFVGDVALDPLTYVGGAGVGLRAVGRGGQTVSVGLKGRRALQGGIKGLVRSGQLGDDVASRLLRAVDATPETIQQARAAGVADDAIETAIRETVFGSEPATRAGRLAAAAGLNPTRRGGLIAERLIPTEARELTERELLQGDAVRDFVAQFGTGSRPGLRFGNAGSQVLHIPFTDIGVSVPAFTRDGRLAVRNRVLATSGRGRSLLNPQVLAMQGQATRAAAAVAKAQEAFDEVATELTEFGQTGLVGDAALVRIQEAQAEATEALDAQLRIMQSLRPEQATQTPQSMADFLHQGRLARITRASAARLAAQEEMLRLTRTNELQAIIHSDEAAEVGIEAAEQTADTIHKAMETLIAQADAMDGSIRTFMSAPELEIVESAKAALGISDDVTGVSLFAPVDRVAAKLTGKASDSAYTLMRWGATVASEQATAFGIPQGALRKLAADYKASQTAGARQAFNVYADSVARQITETMAQHGVPTEQFDEVSGLVTALMYRLRDPEDAIFYTTRFGSDERSGYAAIMEEAIKKGLLDDAVHPGLRASLEQIAAANLSLLDEVGELALDEGMLGLLIQGYIPGVASREAQQLMSSRRLTSAQTRSAAGGGRGQARVREAFQKQRTTTQYRFNEVDPRTGEQAQGRFFEWQRVYSGISERELIEDFTPEAAAGIREIQETIRTYDRIRKAAETAEDAEALARLAGRPTDIFELNELVRQGAFAPLTGGGDLPRQFFDENAAVIMGSRMMAHRRAEGRRYLAEAMKSWMLPIREAELDATQFRQGGTLRTRGGVEARIIVTESGGRRNPTIVIGDQRYRRLSQDVLGSDNPIVNEIMAAAAKAVGRGLDPAKVILHEHAASLIEQAARLFKDEIETSRFLQTADRVTSIWKSVTLTHPSWAVVNIVGDLILGSIAGLRPDTIAKHGKNWMQAVWHQGNPERLRGIRIGDQSALELMQELQANRVAGNGLFMEAPLQFFSNGGVRFRGPGGVKSSWHEAMEQASIAKRLTDNPRAQKALAGIYLSGDVARRTWSGWFNINQKLADFLRGLTYLSLREQGFDATSAAEQVIRHMYDYGDLTRVERRLRLAMPFYSWIKNSAAHQLRLLFERPAYAAAVPKLQVALNEAIAGENAVPEHLRPNWMREQLAIQIGADPEKRWAILPGSAIPQETMMRVIQGAVGADGAMDFLNYFGSSLNPLLRVPTELAFGRELFTDREIGPDALSGDVSALSTIAGQVRPLRELGIGQVREGPLVREFSRGVAPGVGRLLIGGRAQPFGDENIRFGLVRQFKEREEDIRRAIRLAEREGKTDLSLRGRVELLRLYQEMVEAGLSDEVPAWARDQLATVESGSPAS